LFPLDSPRILGKICPAESIAPEASTLPLSFGCQSFLFRVSAALLFVILAFSAPLDSGFCWSGSLLPFFLSSPVSLLLCPTVFLLLHMNHRRSTVSFLKTNIKCPTCHHSKVLYPRRLLFSYWIISLPLQEAPLPSSVVNDLIDPCAPDPSLVSKMPLRVLRFRMTFFLSIILPCRRSLIPSFTHLNDLRTDGFSGPFKYDPFP